MSRLLFGLACFALFGSCGSGLRSRPDKATDRARRSRFGLSADCPVKDGRMPVTACIAILGTSDIPAAHDCFRQSSGGEAAFGYALTHAIQWSADRRLQEVLSRLGQRPWNVRDRLFGPSGWLVRNDAAWGNRVTATLDGAPIALDRIRTGFWGRDETLEFLLRSNSADVMVDVEVPSVARYGDASRGSPGQDWPLAHQPYGNAEVRLYIGDHLYQSVKGNVHYQGQRYSWDAAGSDYEVVLDAELEDRRNAIANRPRRTLHLQASGQIAGCTHLDVPFDGLRSGNGPNNRFYQLILASEPDLTGQQVLDSVVDTLPELNVVAACLDQAAHTPHMLFPVPHELHLTATDVIVRQQESDTLSAFVRMIEGTVTFLTAYDWNIRVGGLVKGGKVDEIALTTELNRHFAHLANREALPRSRDFYAAASAALAHGASLLPGERGPTGALFDGSSMNPEQVAWFRKLFAFMDAALRGRTPIPFTEPQVTLDLSRAFGPSPIDAARVEVYPFDYSTSGGIASVERFWRDLFAGLSVPDYSVKMAPPAPRFPVPDPFPKPLENFINPGGRQYHSYATNLGCQ
jgi:hypothetical protein